VREVVSAEAAWQKPARMVESTLRYEATPRPSGLPLGKLAFGVTVATVLVVLFGAVVRITGSGAGCGQHWPTCNGEVAHLPRSLETWIELGHRTTSGLDFLAVLALLVVTWQRLPARHPARVATAAAFAFMVVEAALGAGLVLLNLVGSNSSYDRAVVMPAHLITTSLLLGSLAATTYFSSERRVLAVADLATAERAHLRAALTWVVIAGTGLLVVSMTGAITALGDTVYPVQGSSTLEHVRNDQAAGAHFLGKVRVVHPLLALLGVAAVWIAGSRARAVARDPRIAWLGGALYVSGALALAIGVANIWLKAPGYMQVLHLLMACLLWIGVVVLGAMLWDAQTRSEAKR
jgi:heme a synthase